MTSMSRGVLGIFIFVVYCGVLFRETGAHDDAKELGVGLTSVNKDTNSHSNSSSSNNSSHIITTNESTTEEITFHTPNPPPEPKAMNMLAEDDHSDEFQPTPVPVTTSTKNIISSLSTTQYFTSPKNTVATYKSTTESNSRGRALNFTIEEKPFGNLGNDLFSDKKVSFDSSNKKNTSTRQRQKNENHHSNNDAIDSDLSNVTIGDEDEEDIPSNISHDVMIVPKILSGKKGGSIQAEPEEEKKTKNGVNRLDHRNDKFGICEQGGLTYENGEKLEHGCDTLCTCNNGKMECVDRCTGPFFKRGKKLIDPLCTAKDADDPCCSVLVCAGDTETEPFEMCTFENKTYQRGDTFNKNCSEICTCEAAGNISCKSRCPPTKKTSDRCVEVPDPKDSCCKQVLCDVTLDDHQDPDKDENTLKTKFKILSATQVNDSVIILDTDPKLSDKETAENLPVAELSNDKSDWTYYQTLPGGLVYVREKSRYLRLEGSDDIIEIAQGTKNKLNKEKENISNYSNSCKYKGKTFEEGETYNDDCAHLCACERGEMKCLKLECPTYFGVDVMDPNCIEWETVPPHFKAAPPKCCPDKIICKNNGSCFHSGMTFKNWEKIPANLTGCEKTCYCEMGHVECQNNCPPVPALPPSNLPCAPHESVLKTAHHDECCKSWECNVENAKLPTSTKSDNKKQPNKINTNDKTFLGPIASITDNDESEKSKLFGPLSVYENDKKHETYKNLKHSLKPHLLEAENPFFKRPQYFNYNISEKSKNQTVKISKRPMVSSPYFFKLSKPNVKNQNLQPPLVVSPERLNLNYINGVVTESNYLHESLDSLNNNLPNYDQNISSQSKSGRPNSEVYTQNLNKTNVSVVSSISEVPIVLNNNIPDHVQNNIYSNIEDPLRNPFLHVPSKHSDAYNVQAVHHSKNNQPQNIQNHEIEIHGHGTPDDLLEFLRNHPEITGLPSGSVLEIKKPAKDQPYIIHKPSKNVQSNLEGHENVLYNFHNQISQEINSNVKSLPNPNLPVVSQQNEIPSQNSHKYSHRHTQYVIPEEYLHQILNNIHNTRPATDQEVAHSSKGQVLTAIGHTTTTDSVNNVTTMGFNNHFPEDFGNTAYNQPREEIEIHTLEAIDAHTVKLAFMVPPIYVGLHGRVEVRYTYTKSTDEESWESQIFAPPDDLIETPSLEFDLHDLMPDKEYQVKISIMMRDLHNSPSSRIYKIRTPKDVKTTTMPTTIPIEPDMEISDINSTWVTVVWRKFTDYELQFIDGVQLRYREVDGKIYAATPLIHRAVTTYTLENLKPNVKYEIGIFFIPFPKQKTELHAEHMLHFTTANEVDTYGFTVVLEITQIKATNVEIAWSGVPYPEDKYVNIYRAIYQSDTGKEDQSTFKIAKRDSPTRTIIMDLKPGTRYRLWLEVYLTNGKIKTSNVQDFITKPRAGPLLGSEHDKVARAELVEATRGDYYGPLVIVAILASIAILSTLILLLILVRRHNQNKAAITPPNSTRLTNGAYDNPTYKVEIQQETMGL